MARVLILRPREEAEETTALLAARGHLPLLLPLHATIPLAVPPPPGPFAAFAVTSRNAVPALARQFPGDGHTVLCVGKRTAEAAREAGFASVEAGEGTAAGLGAMALRFAGDGTRQLLYAAGRVRSGTLEAALDAAGVRFALWETYDTVPLRLDAESVRAATGAAPPDAVLILSAAQAEAFAQLCRAVPALLAGPPLLLCLSERIAAALPADLRAFAAISPSPSLSSLFDRLP